MSFREENLQSAYFIKDLRDIKRTRGDDASLKNDQNNIHGVIDRKDINYKTLIIT